MGDSGKPKTGTDASSVQRFPVEQFRAVAFDAVGTVMYPNPGVAQAYQIAIRRHCGLELSETAVSDVVRAGLSERSKAGDFRTNEKLEHDFWAALIRHLCPDSEGFQTCFDELFEHFGDAQNWRCFPDVAKAIQQIRAGGFLCAVASNFDRRLDSVSYTHLTLPTKRIV